MDQNQNNGQQDNNRQENRQNGYGQQQYSNHYGTQGNPYGNSYGPQDNPYGNPYGTQGNPYGNQYNPYGDYRPPIYFQAGPDNDARSCHTMGLLSVIFIFVSHILSIIFGAIALNYAKKSFHTLGYECPEMKSGRTMGKVGLIVGSILTGLTILIYFVVLIALLA